MSVQDDDVRAIARLAPRHRPAEIPAYAATLGSRFRGADEAVDTTGVVPMAHPLDLDARLREDVVTERDERDALQAGAPLTAAGLYLVPQAIE